MLIPSAISPTSPQNAKIRTVATSAFCTCSLVASFCASEPFLAAYISVGTDAIASTQPNVSSAD